MSAIDFDFLLGSWTVHNRRLRERLKGSTQWDEFEATNIARPLLNGLGNEDEYRTPFWPDFVGMSFRFFDPATQKWSIHWADSRRGRLDPPVVGGFTGDVGVFEGDDVFEGRPIRVRFTWQRAATPGPRWEQAFSADGGRTWETNWTMQMTRDPSVAADFPIVEFRRYTLKPGSRASFQAAFDTFFPDVFQQAGALALGQFVERDRPDAFTWIRGFPDYGRRAAADHAIYDGPVWKEHRAAMNAQIVDSDDVLLLRALPGHGIPVMQPVDPVAEPRGAQGHVIAQLFPVQGEAVESVVAQLESTFEGYRKAGARDAGLLVSVDRPNNFPRHPVRADGPWLVRLGLLPGDADVSAFRAQAERAAAGLARSLRGTPELLVLAPTRRSRLRWLEGSDR